LNYLLPTEGTDPPDSGGDARRRKSKADRARRTTIFANGIAQDSVPIWPDKKRRAKTGKGNKGKGDAGSVYTTLKGIE